MKSLPKAAYITSGPHLSGYQVTLGYETLAEAQDAHEVLAKATTERPDALSGDFRPCENEPDKQPAPAPVGWRPIETAPKDGREVLVWTGRFVRVARFIRECGWMAVGGRQVYVRPITHWMPHPPSPDTASKAGEGEG